ncbi:MAG TPA: DNA-processing protein DprA [Usitatibacter sp.]|nr:DNA-processing protein DprA [Usitatibacter sp.]
MNTPTLEQQEPIAWLRLTLVPGVSPRAQQALLAALGSPQAVIDASGATLAGIAGTDVAQALARGPEPALLEQTLAWLSLPGHHLVTLADEEYPRALLEGAAPPCVLYANGRRELLNTPAIAIVGSRNATPQGTRDAEAFAQSLSDAGLCVVSGLARGIDAAAHRGGLKGRSSSVAVMGTGADRVYPAANRDLARALAQDGCLLTEFPVGTPASAGNFPRRNRLISGLARGVLVVEAALHSGSLITARLAAEQGRDVFAIPGSIHSSLSKGCHELIRQGAKLVESAQDVLVELGLAQPAVQRPPEHHEEDPLLGKMGFAPVSIDQMVELTGLAAASLAAQLSRLEVEGRVQALPGGWFQRIDTAA